MFRRLLRAVCWGAMMSVLIPMSALSQSFSLPELPLEASFILTDGDELLSRQGETGSVPVVGLQSLSLLSAYYVALNEGRLGRNDMVLLDDQSRSPMRGELHRWPNRIAMSVHSLVALMMQEGDHTAMDALTHIIGRSAIEELAGDNIPFLTTREHLILQASSGLREAWRIADASSRDAILDEAARQGLPLSDELSAKAVDDIAWRFDLVDLCQLAIRSQAYPEMRLTNGLIEEQGTGLYSLLAIKGENCLALSTPISTPEDASAIRNVILSVFEDL